MNKKNYVFDVSKRLAFCSMSFLSCIGLFANSPFINETLVGTSNFVNNEKGKTISGIVKDKLGPVIGANVVVKGTNNGVITDLDGKFVLSDVPENAILQISFIGYSTQEIRVSGKVNFTVNMTDDTKVLDEVVVVGYGSQKKVNLTGAVGQIDSKVLESRPITNVESALQGTIPNLQITKSSGELGAGADINVRGTTSINGGSPLVLVDGVQMNLEFVNTNDIASVTVLKDAAAAAIYGVRAAFGVVLITTKSASKTEKTKINYSGNFSFAKPSILPEFIESQSEYAKWINQACINGSVPTRFRDEVIQKMEAYENDPINNPEYEVINGTLYYYGYSDFKEKMVRNVAPAQRHNINITGGSDKTRFYTSIGYLNQEGFYKVGNDSFKQLNTRINVENQTTSWMKLGFKALYNYSSSDKPFGYAGKNFWHRVVYAPPTNYIDAWHKDSRYPEMDRFDGLYLENNAYAILKNAGRTVLDKHDIWLTSNLDINLLKGWKAHIDFNYNLCYQKGTDHSKPVKFFSGTLDETYGETSVNYYKQTNYQTSYYSFNAYTDYENTFLDKHYLKAMIGFNQELTTFSRFDAKRYDSLNSNMPSLSLASGDHEVSQNGYQWALRGSFIRFNYAYNNRYLFEFNGRYDGTSRFPSSDRFVFLPSFSGAWRISEEKFMESTRTWLDNLKIRLSYGLLGNQLLSSSSWGGNTKYYPYIPFMSGGTSTNWIFGNTNVTLINPGNLVSQDLTWEKVSTKNIGLDLTLFDQRFDVSYDYYIRRTSDMLIKVSYPNVLGTVAPPANAAELETRGWELTLSWKDKIGENFSYNIGFVLSDSQAEITNYNNPTGDISTYYNGHKIGEIWGYRVEGLFQNDDEVANWYSQKEISNVVWGAGDIKIKDLDGNENIDDGKRLLDDHGDLDIIGNTTPRYQYGITALNIFKYGVE